MARPKHPKPAIESAIQYAEGCGWRYKPSGKSAHAWGALLCPHNDGDCRCGRFCRSSIWSTPKNPEAFARQVRQWVDNCIHAHQGSDDENL